MNPLSESDYEARAKRELRALVEALDAVETDAFEAELESDILTIDFSRGAPYVINSHRAARQIWMAADRTAWHFEWIDLERAWIAARTGEELWATLARVLTEKLGQPIVLTRPT